MRYSMQDSFAAAVAQGDYTSRLRALRDLVADRLERASPRDAAALAHQLVGIMRELDSLEKPEVADSVDEVAARRAERRAAVAEQAAPRK